MLQDYIAKKPTRPLYLRFKVTPKSQSTKVKEIIHEEETGDTIRINIKAPPIKGKANEELIKFINKETKIPKEKIEIIAGKSDRLKLIKITE